MLAQQRVTLRLAFSERLGICARPGGIDPGEIAMPFRVLAGFSGAESRVVELEEDLSNQVFEILADWNQQLTAEDIDYSGLST